MGESGEANCALIISADPGTGGGNERGQVSSTNVHTRIDPPPCYPNLLGYLVGHECATHTSRSQKSGQVILPPPNPGCKHRKGLAGGKLTVSCGGNPPPGEVEWLPESNSPTLKNPGLDQLSVEIPKNSLKLPTRFARVSPKKSSCSESFS